MSSPKSYRIFHISPGLVQYTDESTGQELVVLVKKETLDQMNHTFKGKPVFSKHKLITSEDAFNLKTGDSENLADGVVTSVGYDEFNGQYFADAIIWDEETQANIDKGYGVSNAYTVDKIGVAGVHNNVPYDEEVLEGTYHHLAIVDSPRYSDTQILQNSKKIGGLTMKFKLGKKGKNLFGKTKVLANQTPTETSQSPEVMAMPEDATVEVEGQIIPISSMVEAYIEAQAALAAAQLENEVEAPSLSMEDTITVDGAEVKVADLYAAYLESQKVLNAEGMSAGTPAEKEVSETDKVRANSLGAVQATPNEHFKLVQNAVNKPAEEKAPVQLTTQASRVVLGKAKYGTVKKEMGNV